MVFEFLLTFSAGLLVGMMIIEYLRNQNVTRHRDMDDREVMVITYDREVDGRWIAVIRVIPGVVAFGQSRAEAAANALAMASEAKRDLIKEG